jgi:transposase
MSPRIYTPRSEQQKEVRDLVKLYESLSNQLGQLKNQFDSTQGTLAKKLLKNSIKSLERNIEKIKSTIDEYVKKNSELSKNVQLLTSIKGLGNLTAYKILGMIPDLALFRNAKQFAAFMGLTPRQYQSGKYQGRTVLSKTGSPAFRKAFYMAALVAKRFNTHLRPFVNRLEAANKSPKAIVCAVMRKLAHIVFGILKSQREFDHKLV